MELDRNIWYVRLFFWSLGIWGAFRGDNYLYDYGTYETGRRGTNLCFFIRVMVVYTPLVLLLHAAFAVAAVASLTALPIYLFGSITYGWTAGAIAVVIGAILGVKMMLRRATQRESVPVKFVEQERGKRPTMAEESKRPSFWAVLLAYLIAAKKKICPSLTFIQTREVHR